MDDTRHLPRHSRRAMLAGLGLAALAGAGGYAWIMRRPFDGATLSPEQAFDRAAGGTILFLDIRRPDEWARTGIPEGAVGLDMRRDDFADRLAALRAPGQPVALICARGVRSSQLSERIAQAGVRDVLDIPEGMLGSAAGPGWLARDLPVRVAGAGDLGA